MLRTKAFFEEFPFLNQVTNPDEVGEARVERADFCLLDSCPNRVYSRPERVFLFSSGGALLGEVGVKEVQPKWWQFWKNNRFEFQERIGEAIARLSGNGRPETHFVVRHDTFVYTLKVVKPPKSFTLQAWVEATYQQHQAEIRARVAKIDAIGMAQQ